jgi:hypothetical protein
LGKKRDPISKITRAKIADVIAQAVECLPNKYTEFKPQYCQKIKRKNEEQYKKRSIVIAHTTQIVHMLKNPHCSSPALGSLIQIPA